MSQEAANLVALARAAAGSIQGRMVPGLADLLLALAAWVEKTERMQHG